LKKRINNPIRQYVGGIPVLSVEKENLLTEWLIKCSEIGDPRTRDELLSAAGNFVDENNQKIFKNGTPTSSWLQGFMKRNPTVAFRTPSAVSRASANVSPAEIVGFIDGVKTYLEKKNLLHLLDNPSAWGNSDETGIDLNPAPTKVLAAKGGRNVYRVETSKPKARVTVLYTFTAHGKMLTPQMIVNESTNTIADIAFACGGEYPSTFQISHPNLKPCFVLFQKSEPSSSSAKLQMAGKLKTHSSNTSASASSRTWTQRASLTPQRIRFCTSSMDIPAMSR
jgi:hypothetical protein